jgi:hypothetical protein
MIILDNNFVMTSTITPSSEAIGYEASTALKDSRLCRFWKTIGATSENCVFNLGSAKAVTYVNIQRHNFTSSATITIQANSSNSWVSPAYSSTAFTVSGITATISFAAKTYQYWRLVVADSTNPDTFLEVGLVYIGSSVAMPVMVTDQTIPRVSNSETDFSVMGQVYGDKRIRYKTAAINFPYVSDTQLTALDTIFEDFDITDPLILIFWEDDLDIEAPLYCILTKGHEPKLAGPNGGWTLSLSFRECK